MPRGKKRCQVKHYPKNGVFSPNQFCDEEVVLTIDEVEAIRLVDYEGLNQVDATDSLGVSRGTVQRLLYSGRKKVADALLHGKHIVIDTYTAPDGVEIEVGEKQDLTIAFVMEGDEIGGHFGRTKNIKIIQVDSNYKIKNQLDLVPTASGGRTRAQMLYNINVSYLFTTIMGDGAIKNLDKLGIPVYDANGLDIEGCLQQLKNKNTELLEGHEPKKKSHECC